MMRRLVALCACLLSGLLLPACGDDSPSGPGDGTIIYVTSDLAGNWRFNSLASGPGEPWWERAEAVIQANGRVTATTLDSHSETDAIVADFAVARDGIVTMDGSSTLRGHLGRDHSLLVLTDRWPGAPYTGTTELKVGVKMGTGYVTRDLGGTWRLSTIASGPGAPWWRRGIVNLTAEGLLDFAFDTSNDMQSTGSTEMTLGANGVATASLFPGAVWAMDATRTLLVATATWPTTWPGTTELNVMVKAPTTCRLADLAGRWECSALATGPGAPYWARASLTIDAAGHYAGTSSTSVGGPATAVSGTLAVTDVGIVSQAGRPDFLGYLNADRTVLVTTDTWAAGATGTTELALWTRLD